jgi:hypothetical protein
MARQSSHVPSRLFQTRRLIHHHPPSHLSSFISFHRATSWVLTELVNPEPAFTTPTGKLFHTWILNIGGNPYLGNLSLQFYPRRASVFYNLLVIRISAAFGTAW